MMATVRFLLLLLPAWGQLMRRANGPSGGREKRLQGALREALRKVPAERVLFVEESLRPSYEAFPKDARGNLPPHQVLPALARAYFAKEHGWLVRGLESPGAPIIAPGDSYEAASAPGEGGDLYQAHVLQAKAPELASALKDAALSPVSSSQGLSLADVAQTVAALEQLLLEESLPLLRASYVLNELDTAGEHVPPALEETQAHEALQSYLLLFRHGLPRDLEDVARHQALKQRAQRSSDWPALRGFEAEVLNKTQRTDGKVTWPQATEAVMSLARQYGRWQNAECQDMKSTLTKMGADGRVLLQDFHGSPKYPHFQFTEKEEYLRSAGILLEEDEQKYVLISNYLQGPSNCIASSEYFAVCCLNECEALVNQFEASLRAPAGSAAQVAETAAALGAAAEAAAELPGLADDSGAVVLHTATFRQWLHRAFPLECARPTAQEDAAEEAELAEAREWLEMDEAARQKWKPLVLHPSECTRLPEWHSAAEGPPGDMLEV
ncbi:unnamed protein product [Effrenium voratum]|uniref:Uncharacterized protein n=1 Tax=Effrenium voratum TaxID=2562239 RepID=A0AA36N8D2_9DINO|nr:unnamed protein product [Effrenium voratum]CAJ1413770.1 unnamed protein product [Effrenium voratum]